MDIYIYQCYYQVQERKPCRLCHGVHATASKRFGRCRKIEFLPFSSSLNCPSNDLECKEVQAVSQAIEQRVTEGVFLWASFCFGFSKLWSWSHEAGEKSRQLRSPSRSCHGVPLVFHLCSTWFLVFVWKMIWSQRLLQLSKRSAGVAWQATKGLGVSKGNLTSMKISSLNFIHQLMKYHILTSDCLWILDFEICWNNFAILNHFTCFVHPRHPWWEEWSAMARTGLFFWRIKNIHRKGSLLHLTCAAWHARWSH